MSYRSILCHVRAGADNSSVLSVSRTLAKLFEASVIGVAGARLTPPFTESPVADMMQMEREAAEKALAQAQEEFRAAFRGSATEVAWRSSCDYASVLDFVIHQARAADLVVTSREAGPVLERSDDTRAGPLALQAGRPILVAPGDLKEFSLHKVLLAWKDSREARRAASDALPLLKRAGEVVVVEVCDPAQAQQAGDRVADVASWLKRHGVNARIQVETRQDSDLDGLYRVLKRENCDFVVAGAYGHTRLQEWIFGGVTKDLLLPAGCCVLLSH